MPLVHGVQMRWTHKKGLCVGGCMVDDETYMAELPNGSLMCPGCVTRFRSWKRRQQPVQPVQLELELDYGESTVSRRNVDLRSSARPL
jgi:hypothetical protein